MRLDTPVAGTGRIIVLLLSSAERARRGPRTRHSLRTINESEVGRRDDTLASPSKGWCHPGQCLLDSSQCRLRSRTSSSSSSSSSRRALWRVLCTP